MALDLVDQTVVDQILGVVDLALGPGEDQPGLVVLVVEEEVQQMKQEVSPILVSAEVVPEYHVGVALVHLEEVAEVEEVDLEALAVVICLLVEAIHPIEGPENFEPLGEVEVYCPLGVLVDLVVLSYHQEGVVLWRQEGPAGAFCYLGQMFVEVPLPGVGEFQVVSVGEEAVEVVEISAGAEGLAEEEGPVGEVVDPAISEALAGVAGVRGMVAVHLVGQQEFEILVGEFAEVEGPVAVDLARVDYNGLVDLLHHLHELSVMHFQTGSRLVYCMG